MNLPRISLKKEREKKVIREAVAAELARQKEDLREHEDGLRDAETLRYLAMTCFALSDTFGFARTRLARTMDAIGKQATQFEEWDKDGVLDYMIAKRLRQLGMVEIAESFMRSGYTDTEGLK